MELTEKKQRLFTHVNELIDKKKNELLKEFPDVHEVSDAIINRFFTEWDNCNDNNDIKFKNIENLDKPDEVIKFMFLPKDAVFELMKRDYIGYITCLNGKLEINTDGEIRIIEGFTKICIENDVFEGRALENTYIITTSK
jgi:molybdopterin converting factor small subunit